MKEERAWRRAAAARGSSSRPVEPASLLWLSPRSSLPAWPRGSLARFLPLSLEHGRLLSLSGKVSMAAANRGNKPRVRSIRFAAGHDAEGSQSHVHFDEKLHDSVVMVTQESDNSFLVKVGFLKILHRYEITFTLPPVRRLSKDIRETPVHSLHLKLLSVTPIPEGYSIKCEYSAHKEGVLKEEMLLACEGDTGTCVRVMVQARVMDRHHGTPMLLDGVKCVGAELEYDSEHSDWHGFD
ncbi:hypothetical protein HispidOSU_024764 [Sigmodon hispidus]